METLEELVHWRAVHDLSLCYATGIDTRDWALYRSCFTDPLRIDFSSFTGRPAPMEPIAAADWVGLVRSTVGGFESTQHLIANHVITFDSGEQGRYTAYIQAQHWMDRDHWYLMGGWYENEVSRVDGQWRIASCTLHQTWDAGDRKLLGESARRVRQRTGRAG